MRKLFVFFTIILGIAAFFAVLPSFSINALGRTFTYPEIDYSKITGAEGPVNLSYKKGKEFEKHTVLTFQLTNSEDPLDTAKYTAEVMKQRLDIMEVVEGEVSYYKNGENYFIQVVLPGVGEEVGSYKRALSDSGNMEIWKVIPQVDEDGDGVADPAPSYSENPMLAGFEPTGVDSSAFLGASMGVNSTYAGYTIKLQVDKDAFLDQTQLLSNDTWVAVSDDIPFLGGKLIASNDNAVLEFIPQEGQNRREDVLASLSLFATRPYPERVNISSEETGLPLLNTNAPVQITGILILVNIMLFAFIYLKSERSFVFAIAALFVFQTLTLLLLKLPLFKIQITLSLIISYIISFVFASGVIYYLITKIDEVIEDIGSKNKFKIMDEFYKSFRKQMNLFLLFCIFLAFVLNLMHSTVYRQFLNGFGFGLVVLFIMLHIFLKPLLKTLYGVNFNLKSPNAGTDKK